MVVQCVVSIHCCCDNRWMRWAGINGQAKPPHQLNGEVTRSDWFRGYNDSSSSKHSIPLTWYYLEKHMWGMWSSKREGTKTSIFKGIVHQWKSCHYFFYHPRIVSCRTLSLLLNTKYILKVWTMKDSGIQNNIGPLLPTFMAKLSFFKITPFEFSQKTGLNLH